MKKTLYEYVVLFHKDLEDKKVETSIIIAPKTILAVTEKDAAFKITREIPDEFAEFPDNIQIIIRPF